VKRSFWALALAGLVAATWVWAPAARAADGLAFPAETVEARKTGANGFVWTQAFDAEVVGEAVRLRVRTRLIPARGVTRPQLERVQASWKRGVEETWSRRFALETPGGERYRVELELDFVGPRFHHEVVVRPGRGRADQLHWRLAGGVELAAHEVGHMLGAFDEYPGGALDPRQPLLEGASIMALDPAGGAVRARHLEAVRAWFEARTGRSARVVSLLPDAEPSRACLACPPGGAAGGTTGDEEDRG
jgi:hypothetical protein